MDVDLGLLEPSDFPKVYDIMEEAFPASETRPYDEAKGLIKDPNYKILLVKNKKGKLGGFLAVWNFPTFNFAEHFAIRKAMRGMGLGSAALKRFLKGTSKPLILEVESYDTPAAKRRINFYERLGFVLNDISYIQPPERKDDPPVPLTIMSHPDPIPKNKRRQITSQIFQQVYQLGV